MSIGSLQTNPWANPWAVSANSPTETSAAQSTGFWATQNASDTTSTAAASANPFQTLASDIQAMLIQAQTAGAKETPATTAASNPETNLATALQTLMTDLQASGTSNTQSSTQSNSRTASTDPTGAASQTAHHHHHHHDADGEANGATATASGSSTTNSTTLADEAASQSIAADITQALTAYGGVAAGAMMPALMI